MKPNVEIRNGRLEVIEDLKAGNTLIYADFPLGLAMHDMKKGDEVKYDPTEDTEDVVLKAEWRVLISAMSNDSSEEETKYQAVQDIKVGEDLFWYGMPIGVAARDIPNGTTIDYKENKNTADVIAR